MKRLISNLLFAAMALAPLAAPAQQEKFPLDQLKAVDQKWPDAKKTSTGLRYIMQIEGTGEAPKRGDVVEVLYVGKLLDGTVFDKNENVMAPFKFRIGRNEVIDGWEYGIQLLKKGGKMTLIVPPSLGYGTKGEPAHGIPRNAVLVFEISLLNYTRDTPLAPAAAAKKK